MTVDTTGWVETEVTETSRTWTRDGDLLRLNYFPGPPDLPRAVGDDSALVDFLYRDMSNSPGGLVEAKWTQGHGSLPVARIITKYPQEPHGISYHGSLLVPFRACGWAVLVDAREFGMTGVRETIWASKVSQSEGVGFQQLHDRLREENDRLRAKYGGSSAVWRQPSDDEEWDGMFPEHPLSRVRRYLPLLASSIVLGDKARRLDPFP